MLYKQLLRKFNEGVIVRDGVPQVDNPEHQQAILDDYTGTFQTEGALVGIKPMSTVEGEHLDLEWEVSVLRYVDGQLRRIEMQYMVSDEVFLLYHVRNTIDHAMTSDDDLDLVLKEEGFRRHSKENEL
tara:strand:+ start:19512 stop:19895 length:384 start_codon:yes stop_codon:yes gene_type:complete